VATLQCLFIADGGIDNKPDGRIYEVRIGSGAVPPGSTPLEQAVTTKEDTPVAIRLSGTEIPGRSLTYSLASSPQFGTLTGTAPRLTYTPHPDFHGTDRFQFRIDDGTDRRELATVAITVTPVNDLPLAQALTVFTARNTAAQIVLVGSDADGDPLKYSVSAKPKNGRLSGSGSTLTYTPKANFLGTDTFTYRVQDGIASSPAAVVTVHVSLPPVATSNTVDVIEDIPQSITLSGTDPGGRPLRYSIESEPVHGMLTGTAPHLVYTPRANYFGADSFQFRIQNDLQGTAVGTVSLRVTAVDDPPLAEPVSAHTTYRKEVAVRPIGTDVDSPMVRFQLAAAPRHGAVIWKDTGWSYTPAAGFVGIDEFTYQADDGSSLSAPATATVHVSKLPAVAHSSSLTIEEEGTRPVVLTGTDPDGVPLRYILAAEPAHGVLHGNPPVSVPGGQRLRRQ
jgi:large repetitive protein